MDTGLGCVWPEEGALFSFHEGHAEFCLSRGWPPFLLHQVTTLTALCSVSTQCAQEGNGAEARDLTGLSHHPGLRQPFRAQEQRTISHPTLCPSGEAN